jgi:hypothetical protein
MRSNDYFSIFRQISMFVILRVVVTIVFHVLKDVDSEMNRISSFASGSLAISIEEIPLTN